MWKYTLNHLTLMTMTNSGGALGAFTASLERLRFFSFLSFFSSSESE